MFGYVQVLKPELKVKDFETYHSFYCGLCRMLKKRYGFLGQLSLTYDMTFLTILLTSAYDLPVRENQKRCKVHPAKKHVSLTSDATAYAAQMNIILTYYKLKDDANDDRAKKAAIAARAYRRKEKKAAFGNREKEKKIAGYLAEMESMERQGSLWEDLADCFGRLMEVLFCYRDDVLSVYLKQMGYHMGRFLYLMDAYDDLEKDRKKGRFNPLFACAGEPDFEKKMQENLLDEMALAAEAFEKLPCLDYTDILGNIIYAGVWNRFDQKQHREEEKHGDKHAGSLSGTRG